jgi:hypothetical protein
MASDIQFDGDKVVFTGRWARFTTHDIILDHEKRRDKKAGKKAGERRALVHNTQDGLTINFAGDYPGGVTIEGEARLAGPKIEIGGRLHVDGEAQFDGPVLFNKVRDLKLLVPVEAKVDFPSKYSDIDSPFFGSSGGDDRPPGWELVEVEGNQYGRVSLQDIIRDLKEKVTRLEEKVKKLEQE